MTLSNYYVFGSDVHDDDDDKTGQLSIRSNGSDRLDTVRHTNVLLHF